MKFANIPKCYEYQKNNNFKLTLISNNYQSSTSSLIGHWAHFITWGLVLFQAAINDGTRNEGDGCS